MVDTLGFGEQEFGEDAFGDAGDAITVSGALPNVPPFDIYSVSALDTLSLVTGYSDVTYVGTAGQQFLDGLNDFGLRSGGAIVAATGARLEYDTTVPETFTAEIAFKLNKLPINFADITNRHVLISVADGAGSAFSLFISQIGLLYTGAVHFSGGDVVLDHPAQPLPNSQSLVELDVFYTLRFAVSTATGTAYIYWTRSEDVPYYGHQLRYVIPAFDMATAVSAQPDLSIFSVRGTVSEPSEFVLSSTSLGEGLLIPNLRPVANAGSDQALRSCAIAQLDGSQSFDPEGASVTYKWRLIDAPLNSMFAIESLDALTYPDFVPTGFTDKVYSSVLDDENAEDPLEVGDAFTLDGEVYEVSATGTDGNGFFVQVAEAIIPDSFATGTAFKFLRQRGISGATTVAPTFLPDLPGLYKFDLVVFDGSLYSEPALTILNVTASPLPRGLIPDLKFLWDYLGDFWRLVEDRERITVFWGALAQFAASELLTFWQTDYSKSLRDVQRTFQRRWLHYDLLMREDSRLIELSTVRAVYGGISSSAIPLAGVSGIAGEHLDIFTPISPLAVPIYFSGTDPQTAQQICDRINAFMHAVDPLVVAKVITDRDGLNQVVRIDAPYAVSISSASTVTIFGVGANSMPLGAAGVVTGVRTYRVDRSLEGLAIREGDFLSVGAGTYRISRVVDDLNDPLTYQRVTLLDDIPFSAGADWLISGQATSESLDFYGALFTAGDVATFEIVDLDTNGLSYIAVPVTGACETATDILGVDASLLGQYIGQPDRFKVHFHSGTRRQYTPINELVSDVPYLQEKIKNEDDTAVIRRNLDFFIDTFRGSKCIRFVVDNDVSLDVWEGLVPPDRLWAELTYLDNRPTIEANFGIPAEFTLDDLSLLPDNVDYLSAVRGLWYAYFSGPTLFNLRAGVQILLGLPYAEATSTIEEIRDDFSTTFGRLLLRDVKDTEIVRTYQYPHGLEIDTNPATGVPFVVGDTANQFAPLVKGADVIDYVKDPTWFSGLLNQGSFSEVEKFFKFLVRVDSTAFNLNALLLVRQFILRIKPTYTLPLFVVRADLGEAEVSVSDTIVRYGVLSTYAGPLFGPDGQAQMFDQPRPGGGGFWSRFDTLDPSGAVPTSPTPDAYTEWGFDEYLLAPVAASVAVLKSTWPGGIPIAGSIFYAGLPIFTQLAGIISSGGIRNLTLAGVQLGVDEVCLITDTITRMVLFYRAVADAATLTLTVKVNGITVDTQTFNPPVGTNPDANQYREAFTVSIPVVAGDVLSAFVSHPTGFNTYVESAGVVLGVGEDWFAGVALGAGTYFTYLVL